ncbi:MAG: 5-(carboxyamino)imidazole ribonucleotide synthase [Patescibacteria group bacterium]
MNNSVSRIGILGGGQLARMSLPAARKLGISVTVLDPTPDCPAAQAGANQITSSYINPHAIHQLAAVSDVLTVELEHVDAETLTALAAEGKAVIPRPDVLQIIQNKFRQKQVLAEAGVPVAQAYRVSSVAEIQRYFGELGSPIHLKAAFGSYDGKGNYVVRTPEDAREGWNALNGDNRELYVEQDVPFIKELAMMAVSRKGGKATQLYPLVETVHENNICHLVMAPAMVTEDVRKKAEMIVQQVLQALGSSGIYGIELFFLEAKDGAPSILVNEIAPRPHNSGHYTIEACQTSQFENFLRVVSGKELGSSSLRASVKAATMINILGDREGSVETQGIDEVSKWPGVTVHLYGKQTVKPGRKMGHITVCAESVERSRQIAQEARSHIII